MLSQTAEHALRALLYLAQRTGQGSVPAEEIASAIGAPRNYLAKTLNALARRGYVEGTRGPGGGFQLALDPAELAISRLIEEFDSSPPHVLCLLGGRPCNAATPCAAHDRWLRMWEESLAPLRSTTLADLLGRDEAGREISPYRDSRGTLQLQRQG